MPETRSSLYKRVPIQGVDRFERFRETGEIVKDDYIGAVKKKILGREFNSWSSKQSPFSTLWSMMEASPIFSERVHQMTARYDGAQHAIVEYRKHRLFSYDIKKKKGRYHASYWRIGHYYDWEVSDVVFNSFPEDLAKALDKIDAICEEEAIKRDKANEDLYSLFKEIAALRPDRDLWALCEDLKKICDKGYVFRTRYAEEARS